MRIYAVPRAMWVSQLNEFTTMYEGWLASVEVLAPDIGAQREITDVPFVGVSADRVNHDGTIAISVASSRSEHFTHLVSRVTRIYIEQHDEGGRAMLLVESGDGTRTVLQLRAPAVAAAATP